MAFELVEPVVEPTPEPPTPPIEEAPPVETPIVEAPPDVVAAPTVPDPDARHRSAQRRINEITRKMHDAERDAEYWRSRATQGSEQAPQEPHEPQPDEFDTQEGYIRAAARWEAYQVQSEAAAAAEKREAEATRGAALKQFESQLDKARQVHEDFDEVIASPVFTVAMQQAIFESDTGAEVAYYLGTHEDEAKRISNLAPSQVMREIIKIENKLATPAPIPPKRVSMAPAPITPLGGGGASTTVDPSRMTTAEWMEWDRNQTLERLKAKPF